ncbi:SGNH/GDSL hydrolase family protein [Chitinophaga alhagiae]|uniref:SGNH/GDSL hydrolase family protein n=1 Tax=Chitinophaga alhagiae TaxID=2203219 RepID=UPI001E5708E9|nr:SGNH/GDSL hydrolase family protein [Chitinophaga alhagiae]
MKSIFSTAMSLLLFLFLTGGRAKAQASPDTYLAEIKAELNKQWPGNRTVNLVFHGHSVPAGYFNTPHVNRPEAYPFLVFRRLQKQYPYAVVNSITTSIGGENSAQGEKRFKKDVLPHRPDVLFIDYGLNDRRIGLEKARVATEKMIRLALKKHIKVILITPSPDLKVDITQPGNILEQHAAQLAELAKKYHIGLANSYAAFVKLARAGENLRGYMSQYNHPNAKGHTVIAGEVMKWFE